MRTFKIHPARYHSKHGDVYAKPRYPVTEEGYALSNPVYRTYTDPEHQLARDLLRSGSCDPDEVIQVIGLNRIFTSTVGLLAKYATEESSYATARKVLFKERPDLTGSG